MRQKLILALFGLSLTGLIVSSTLRIVASAQPKGELIDSAANLVKRMSDQAPRAVTAEPGNKLILRMYIDGAIGAVTDDRIADAIKQATEEGAELIVIYLDTPGGFTKPTWSITKRILNSPVPICIYIAPSGARAGSAGVYMTYAAHFAAMAYSTNIGAAHPVGAEGQKIDSVMNEKITNDAVAQIKAFADRRHRNAKWAEEAVRQSVSITDREALDSNVIDIRAEDYDDLLRQLNGRKTEVPAGEVTINTVGARTKDIKHTFAQKMLEIITSPDVAFILFSIGGLGIVLELYNPGAILPGVVGAICLILAFYSFQTLPINYAGVLLIILAIVLFIAEIKVVSHGLLTIGGVVSLFLGGMMLIKTSNPALQVSISILVTISILVGVTVAIVIWLVTRAARHAPWSGDKALIGKKGVVHQDGFVYVDGALWKMISDEPLEIGAHVEITGVDHLTLKVKKL
ncbi:serine protease [candidate division GN15 bacterium]|uniref:Serine protease n=1 Tax=candidate division GN15 bacterium TaxID=2072418 RepID=A0A855X025_9BACT|nr:MAG: serine protease [candidate division GN15 bacterium]